MLLIPKLTSSLVATVVLSQDQAAVIEGNSTMNTTIDFYVVLSDDKDGIDREVIVNVSAYEISATGTLHVIKVTLKHDVIFPQ